jgi:DNA-binding transcriptional MerR regulator
MVFTVSRSLDFERARSRSVVDMAITISDAARLSGVSAHTLRYYERAGLLDPVGRDDSSGHRRFTDEDLARVEFLTKLRATGMPIREVRRYAELIRRGDGTNAERLAIIEGHREVVLARLDEAQRTLELVDFKINLYRKKLA